MAKDIILLSAVRTPIATTLQYLYWVPVPTGLQAGIANASTVSAFTGATVVELSSLQTGAITEVPGTYTFTSGVTVAQVKSTLIAGYVQMATAYANMATVPDVYGMAWDGTVWSTTS